MVCVSFFNVVLGNIGTLEEKFTVYPFDDVGHLSISKMATNMAWSYYQTWNSSIKTYYELYFLWFRIYFSTKRINSPKQDH